MILFVMAATSHDFWLKTLGASAWKALHMGVYLAWGLILVHVALGLLQSERSVVVPVLMFAGVGLVGVLHLVAWKREAGFDRAAGADAKRTEDGIDVCAVNDLDEGESMPVVVNGERLALCKHEGKIHALHGVCRHQGGPLAEGKIIDGCLTCPWHGWQYQPGDGTSSPPFEEVVATYPVRIVGDRVVVDPEPNPLAQQAASAAHKEES